MADVIYKVFVSSTYEDLRVERSELQKALLRLKCLPVGMELFPSADDETWEFIKGQIDDSDYYVLIIAGRYGSEAPDGISFTEKEYDYAREIGKRTIAFLHENPSTIPVGKVDRDKKKQQKLSRFIAKTRKHPVNFFTGPHDLAANATLSFIALRDRYPATGFVRADQTVDYKKYAELLEENRQINEKLSAALADSEELFRGAHGTVSITASLHPKFGPFREGSVNETWGNIYVEVADNILDGISDAYNIMDATVKNFFNKTESYDDIFISDGSKKLFKKFFNSSRLIETGDGPDGRGNVVEKWRLTEYGKQQYGLLKQW